MKITINGITYTCGANGPHGFIRDLMIEAQMNGTEIQVEKI